MAISVRRVRQFYTWHKWTGLITGIFILIINFSGAVVVFKDEIDRFITPAKVVHPQAHKASLDMVLENMRHAYPGIRAASVNLPSRPDAAMVILATQKRNRLEVFADPYSGAITGARSGETLANVLRQLHLRFYFFGFWGRVVVGFFGVVLLVSTITGLVIYWRFMRGVFSRGLRFWNLRPGLQLTTSDLHKLIGIGALAFNLLIALTGAILGLENLTRYTPNLAHALRHLPESRSRMGADQPRGKRIATFSIDAALDISLSSIPGFEPQSIALPGGRSGEIEVLGRVGGILARDRSSFVIMDAASGSVIEKFRQTDGTTTNKLFYLVEPLHYGAFAGFWGKVVYLIFGFTGAFLAISGFVLWWLKWKRGYSVKADGSKGDKISGRAGAMTHA